MNGTPQQSFRFRHHAWRHFKRNKPAVISMYVLAGLLIIALLAPLLANERPLYMRYAGENFFPAFSLKKNYSIKRSDGSREKMQLDITDWKKLSVEKIIWAPITYSPGKSDYYNANYLCPSCAQKFSEGSGQTVSMPSRFRHWLGTGNRGDDLLSGLIHGARVSLTIGFLSMGIATFIGIFLGAFAGFFGDDKLVTSRGRCYTTILGLIFGWFYAFQLRSEALVEGLGNSEGSFIIQFLVSIIIFTLVILLFSFAGKLIGKLPWLNRPLSIPADGLISRLIEIMVSLPLFMLIVTVAAISKPSLVNVMVIIGLTNWTGIARLTRAEMLRVRQQEFIQSAQALGYNPLRIILRHALPNAVAPALVSVSFGIANAILIESALSFIGLGSPPDITTWGSLLSAGQGDFYAWWMVVFPGLCIFITVSAYNLVGEGLRDAFDPKLKK